MLQRRCVNFWAMRCPTYDDLNGCLGSTAGLINELSSSATTRYDSDAHAPKSMSLQRSEQNGREIFFSIHSTVVPQVGQLTVRLITRSRLA